MSKRKINDANIEQLRKKFKLLEEKLENLQSDRNPNINNEPDTNGETEGSESEGSGSNSDAEGSLQNEDNEGNKENTPNEIEKSQEENIEAPIDEEIASILGQDPLESKALDIKVHSSVHKRWKYWFMNGIEKEERESLLEKYKSPAGLEVLKLNPEISLKMAKHSKARDTYMSTRQQLAGSALASIGWAMTTLIEEKESIDKTFLIERLHDAGKMISDMMHSQNKSRVALIVASLDKETKNILEDTKPDEFLFGKNLSERIKEAKSIDKVANSMKKNFAYKNQTPLAQRQNLNYNSLQGRRPLPNQAGFSQGQSSTQTRPRLFFKTRNQNQQSNQNQQPNQRIQYQGYRKFQNKPR